MVKNIAVISGGDSSERVISVKSARQVATWIDQKIFDAYIVHLAGNKWEAEVNNQRFPIDKNDFTFTVDNQKIVFDCAVIMIHGTPGEDGRLQGYFDMLKIPYTTSGVLASSLTFNKSVTKQFARDLGIPVAREILVKKHHTIPSQHIVDELGLPCFVKPNNAGSSFGVTRITDQKDLARSIQIALMEDQEVLIEEMLDGREVTCGIIKTTHNSYILPITEIVSQTTFFDFQAKYEGKSEEITPALIPDQIKNKCNLFTDKIYDAFNLKGIARVDFIIKNHEPYLLEVNTVPGMSESSIIPQQLEKANLSVTDIFTELINDCMNSLRVNK
ncbi:MAG: D-alanine--D-alanine ligase [Bacteroidetes bacterium]|nr:D-alanine--D-alanine ligase [Bacteroidota bacterium]